MVELELDEWGFPVNREPLTEEDRERMRREFDENKQMNDALEYLNSRGRKRVGDWGQTDTEKAAKRWD